MKYSPSAADRWLACPGSVPLSIGRRGGTSKFAAEGSVAHDVLETVLRLEIEPESMLGKKFEQDYFDFEVDQAMVDAVNFFLEYAATLPPGEVVIEKRIEGAGKLVEGFNGRIDYGVFVSDTEAVLVDFKYGAGVVVDIEGNAQMMSYAALLLTLYPKLETVRLAIVQPRTRSGAKIKEHEVTRAEILDFIDDVRIAVHNAEDAKALPIESQVNAGLFATGSHCRWCPAKPVCPMFHAPATEAAGKSGLPVFTAAGELDVETLVYWLDNAKLFREWLDSLHAYADSLLRDGKDVGNYKLVESIANRRWQLSDVELEAELRKFGFAKKAIYAQSVLSPVQIEKLVPPKGKDKKAIEQFVASLTHRPVLGLKMAAGDDRREVVDRMTPEEAFAGFG